MVVSLTTVTQKVGLKAQTGQFMEVYASGLLFHRLALATCTFEHCERAFVAKDGSAINLFP